MNEQKTARRVKVRHLCPAGHQVDLDNVSYGLLLLALTVAADHDPERAGEYKRLRSELSKG